MADNPYLLLGAGLIPVETEKPLPPDLRQVGLKVKACKYFPDGSSGPDEVLLLLISEPKLLELMDYLHGQAKELLE